MTKITKKMIADVIDWFENSEITFKSKVYPHTLTQGWGIAVDCEYGGVEFKNVTFESMANVSIPLYKYIQTKYPELEGREIDELKSHVVLGNKWMETHKRARMKLEAYKKNISVHEAYVQEWKELAVKEIQPWLNRHPSIVDDILLEAKKEFQIRQVLS